MPTWPNHTSVPATYLAGFISTALATDTLQGHVSLERAERAEAAPVCYEACGLSDFACSAFLLKAPTLRKTPNRESALRTKRKDLIPPGI